VLGVQYLQAAEPKFLTPHLHDLLLLLASIIIENNDGILRGFPVKIGALPDIARKDDEKRRCANP